MTGAGGVYSKNSILDTSGVNQSCFPNPLTAMAFIFWGHPIIGTMVTGWGSSSPMKQD